MNLFPSKFTMGGVEYKVLEPEMCTNVSHFGESNSIDATITVAQKMVDGATREASSINSDVRNETFFHELLHVIINHQLLLEFDETSIQQTAVLLHQFIKENYTPKEDTNEESTENKA